jgi:lysophospholipase L1-like esterase
MPGISFDFWWLRRAVLPHSRVARLRHCALATAALACAACAGDVNDGEEGALTSSREPVAEPDTYHKPDHTLARALYGTSEAAMGPFSKYLALGDSYSASVEGDWLSFLTCPSQSQSAWPNLLFKEVVVTNEPSNTGFRACAGATTADLPGQYLGMTQSFQGPDTLITVTIGGNDIGVSSEVMECVSHSINCDAKEAEIAQRIETIAAPNLRNAFANLRRTFPSATIVAVGYPLLLAEKVSNCFEGAVTQAEASMVREAVRHMNGVIALEADNAGIMAVTEEVAEAFAGHEVCSADPYIGGTFHPTVAGHRLYSAVVSKAISGLIPDRIAAVDRAVDPGPDSDGFADATSWEQSETLPTDDAPPQEDDGYDEQEDPGDYDEQEAAEDDWYYQ